MNDYYNYQKIKEKALSRNSTPDKRIEFFVWHERYDPRSWNGEEFHIEDQMRLRPVYAKKEEDFELIDCEIIYN